MLFWYMDHVTVGNNALFSLDAVILILIPTQTNLEKNQCSKTKNENYKFHIWGQVTQAMRGCAARTWEESHTPGNIEIGQGQHLLMFMKDGICRRAKTNCWPALSRNSAEEVLQNGLSIISNGNSPCNAHFLVQYWQCDNFFVWQYWQCDNHKRGKLLKYSNTDQRAMWMTILSQSVSHLWLNQLISIDNDNNICST